MLLFDLSLAVTGGTKLTKSSAVQLSKVSISLSKQPVEEERNTAGEEESQFLACAWSKTNVSVPLGNSFIALCVLIGQPMRCWACSESCTGSCRRSGSCEQERDRPASGDVGSLLSPSARGTAPDEHKPGMRVQHLLFLHPAGVCLKPNCFSMEVVPAVSRKEMTGKAVTLLTSFSPAALKASVVRLQLAQFVDSKETTMLHSVSKRAW